MTILVIAEHDNAALKAATLNTVAAAQKIGGEIHVLVAGAGCAAAAQQAAGNDRACIDDSPQHYSIPPFITLRIFILYACQRL